MTRYTPPNPKIKWKDGVYLSPDSETCVPQCPRCHKGLCFMFDTGCICGFTVHAHAPTSEEAQRKGRSAMSLHQALHDAPPGFGGYVKSPDLP